ncbi:MAG: UDP-N-acetylglucosamine--N-acetylmuramyl-(pentapeptide) pyrophosphoryl-undecaprenol N-acetylglucosamine transferase [Puniceicoccales bacterium]|jgi:UDP-N-acetylglucosamine--N-acetylmuramyl-(pentapeptide) pyrophosphoryl-undecaprenol N-acetylglucosamine transferase|nr:UDP-N-acetylglucosamine--N-acetylmuramyl-(pentapeptide) pyrophosphoryl-undecaprenol N-acetylglucosamine transferase [Puniceicoccales bacterium]
MRILIICGGTGGHLTPGIAVAQRLRRMGQEVILATSEKAIDEWLRSHYKSLRFTVLSGSGFSFHPIRFLRFLKNLWKNFRVSWKLLRAERIDVVLAFGGFISLGAGFAAFLRRKPLLLHESNQRLGKSVGFLAPLAKKIFIPPSLKIREPYVENANYFPAGFPLREDFQPPAKNLAREQLGFPKDGKILLVMGGSQGAQVLVEWVRSSGEFLAKEGISVFCLTGLGGLEGVTDSHENGVRRRVQFLPFSHRMHVLYAAADLVLCRAGAGTIAELIASVRPSILVPYPKASKDHQRANANALQGANAARVLQQSDMSMLEEVISELFDPENLREMECQLLAVRKIIGQDAAQYIANEVMALRPNGDGQKNF